MRKELVIAAFGLVTVLAIAGWVRQPVPVAATSTTLSGPPQYPATSQTQNPVPACNPVSANAISPATYSAPYHDDESVGNQLADSGAPAHYGYESRRPIEVRQNYESTEPVSAPPLERPVAMDPQYEDRQYVRNERDEYDEHHHRRSGRHSAMIVAGTAGAGAAIGAVAGGGKGAAIGALSGAGAGFVYDRLTHNR